MPIDDKGRIVCSTHRDEQMVRQPSYYFLNEAEKDRAGRLRIIATSGIPLVTFACKICGYIETYAAIAGKEWNVKRLYVKCKNEKCKREFLSPIQMDESSFETTHLENNQYKCYFCNQKNMYDKKEHFFK